MPVDRFFHPRLGHSAKVNSLTDFEDLVWRQYILSADDFGVMRFDAITVQADYERLAKRPAKAVQKALERIRDVGLVQTFEHQGRVYCYQRDWQNYQRVKHPRQTINPRPPGAALEQCSTDTRKLFKDWPGKTSKKLEKDSGNSSAEFPPLARAGAYETATAKANGSGSEGREGGAGETIAQRAGAFSQWYEDTYQRLLGVGYMGTNRDWETLLRLCEKFTDQQLHDAALVWFGADDDFARNGTRTIPKFASRVSGYLELIKARGIA